MPRRVVDPRVVALGVGVPLVILVLVVVVLVRADGAQETTSTTTTGAAAPPAVDEVWNDDLGTAVEPLNTVLVDLAATVDAWSVGDVDDAELEALLDRAAPVVEGVRRAAESLDDHPEEPVARPLVVHMAELYVRSVEAHRLALATSDDIRTQYDRLGRRLRILADRVFDRARERTSARIDPGPDISVVLPAEVPDWERLEIAAGQPLVAADPNRPGELPLSREDDRPTQDEDAWLRDVAALDVPTAGGSDPDRRLLRDGSARGGGTIGERCRCRGRAGAHNRRALVPGAHPSYDRLHAGRSAHGGGGLAALARHLVAPRRDRVAGPGSTRTAPAALHGLTAVGFAAPPARGVAANEDRNWP